MSAFGSIVFVAALVGAEVASAPPGAAGEADLVWSAPPGCPDRQALLAGVARRRGAALEPGTMRVSAQIVTLGPRRYRMVLELEIAGRQESRVLEARTCAALVDAAALRITVAAAASPVAPPELPLEPAAPPELPLAPATAPAPEEPAAPPDPSLDPLAPPPTPAPETPEILAPDAPPGAPEPVAGDGLDPPAAAPRRRGPGGFLRLHGLGEYGALPGPSGGVGLVGGLLLRRIRLEVHATYVAPRALSRAEAEVRASLVAGAALGCARPGRGALEVPLCGGLEVGGMPGSADGPGIAGAAFGGWLAGVVTVGASWRVAPRVALWGAVHGLAAIRRPAFVLRDPGPELVLFDPGVLSGRLALGVELRFGDPAR